MNRLCTRMHKVEASWFAEQCRRMDQMTDEELAALIGPGAGEYMDTLPLSVLTALAQGDPHAMQRFMQDYEAWREGQR
jgi:hypothetical protein